MLKKVSTIGCWHLRGILSGLNDGGSETPLAGQAEADKQVSTWVGTGWVAEHLGVCAFLGLYFCDEYTCR